MSEDAMDQLSARLAVIEARLDTIERRIGLAPTYNRPTYTGPTYTGPTPPAIAPKPFRLSRPAPTEASPPPARTKIRPPEDTEYFLGAKVLPRVAAGVLILGLIYLVTLLVQNGAITPAMLFGGVCAVCAGFIGLGILKRNEREEFGQILTGVGSCGLYLNFAAGQSFQHLYSGRTLVLLFVVLSLSNLAYSFWRASRAFLAIGLLGGLTAALLPLHDHNFALDATLHFLILIPAALIAARYRWRDVVVWTYALATLAALPMIDTAADWRIAVFTFFGVAVVAASAYAYRFEPVKWDPQIAFVPAAIFGSGLIGFGIRYDLTGAAAVLLYALVAAAAGGLLRNGVAGRRLALSGVALAAALPPFGFPAQTATLVLAGLSLACAGLSFARFRKELAALAVGELGLALGTYLSLFGWETPAWRYEIGLLALLLVAALATARAMVRAYGFSPLGWQAGTAVCVPLLTRLVQLSLGAPTFHATPELGVTFGLLLGGAVVVALIGALRIRALTELLGLAIASGLIALWVVAQNGLEPGLELPLLVLFSVLVTAGAFVTSRRVEAYPKDFTALLAGLVVGTLLLRFGVVVLTLPALGMTQRGGFALTASLLGVAMALGSKKEPTALGLGASLFTVMATFAALGAVGDLPWGEGLGTSAAALIAIVLSTGALRRSPLWQDSVLYASALGAWVLLTRLGILVLTAPEIGLATNAAVTTSWIVTGVALLTVGFLRDFLPLRYSALAIFATTVGKVILVDLANTSQIVKIAVLMALGLAMLGGGYVYIRRRGATS